MAYGWGGARPGSGRKPGRQRAKYQGTFIKNRACIYIITEVGSDAVCKIGVTTNLGTRLSGLQTGNPRKLCIFAAYEVRHPDLLHDLERQAKLFFSKKVLSGEWFEIPPAEMKEAIETALESLSVRVQNLVKEIVVPSLNVISFTRSR